MKKFLFLSVLALCACTKQSAPAADSAIVGDTPEAVAVPADVSAVDVPADVSMADAVSPADIASPATAP